MTASTATAYEGVLDYEYVVLTLSDGETYVSNLSKPYGAILTEANSDSTAGSAVQLDYALSGITFTIRYNQSSTAVTDKKVAMCVYGRK